MAETKLISPGIPNYTLKRNLRLNDKYLSNDGGNEGITIANSGSTTISVVDASSLKLDGNDYITFGNVLNDTFTGSNKKFTIGAWVKPTTTTGVQSIVSKFKTNEREFSFYAEDGRLKLKLAEDGTDTTPAIYSVDGDNQYSALFNNSNDSIILPSSALFTQATASFTFWIKLTAEPEDIDTIFTKDYYADTSINFTSTSHLRFYNGAVGTSFIKTTTALSIGTWYHIACTFGTGADGTGSGTAARIYIDGVADELDGAGGATYIDQALWDFNIAAINGVSGYIGNNTSGSRAIPAYLDEFCIWDSALTGSDVSDIYNDGTAIALPTAETTDKTVGRKLVGYYRFENSVTLGEDSSETGDNGTLVGTPTQSSDVPGGTSKLLTVGDWNHVGVTVNLADDIIIIYKDGSDIGSYTDGVFGGNMGLTNAHVTTLSDTGAHLAVGSAHGEDAVNELNGTVDDVSIFNTDLDSEDMARVGGDNKPDLTVPGNYNNEASRDNLVGYWRFDEGTGGAGDTIADKAGANDGTIVGDPTWAEGTSSAKMTISSDLVQFHVPIEAPPTSRSSSSGFSTNPQNTLLQASAKSVKFNGSDEYIACGDVLDTDAINKLSVAFWVNFTTIAGEQQLITKGAYNVSGDCWAIKWDAGTLRFSVSNSITAVDTDLKLNINTWYHIVVTYSNTSDALVFYLNGATTVASGFTISGSYITIPANTGRDVRIGFGYDAEASDYFNGKMQEVGIWDTALSGPEVTAIYNSGRTLDLSIAYGNYAKQGDLQGYWKLNEATGFSFTDSSTFSNTGSGIGIGITNWVDGNTISTLDSDYDSVKVYKELDIKNAALKLSYDANDYATLAVANTGDLTISTIGDGTRDSDLTLNADGDIKLEPATGNSILLDGTIDIDAGVITGATSISSTSFIGALTGNASGTAATVTGSAQTAITSVGTLTSLVIDTQLKIAYDVDSFTTMAVTDSSHLTIATAESGLILLDAGGDIRLDAAGGNITILQADLVIPVDKKVTFGNAGEYISGDNTDLNIVSSNDISLRPVGNTIRGYSGGTNTIVMELDCDGITGAGSGIRFNSILDTNDYFRIDTTTLGATIITTDDNGGVEADLTFNIDGKIDINSATGEDIILDAGGGIHLDAYNGECRLTDDSQGGNVFTPSDDADITTKKYVDDKPHSAVWGGALPRTSFASVRWLCIPTGHMQAYLSMGTNVGAPDTSYNPSSTADDLGAVIWNTLSTITISKCRVWYAQGGSANTTHALCLMRYDIDANGTLSLGAEVAGPDIDAGSDDYTTLAFTDLTMTSDNVVTSSQVLIAMVYGINGMNAAMTAKCVIEYTTRITF